MLQYDENILILYREKI